jgi:diguanylate cyclase (GGDEF)-like protein
VWIALPWGLSLAGYYQTPDRFALASFPVGVLWLLSFLPVVWLVQAQWQQVLSQLAKQEQALALQVALATTDALTGLMNRRQFNETLKRETARSKRSQANLSLALFDIDHFKRVNDVYGHSVGDRILQEVSGLIAQNLRQSDMVARYGGEEFALILPDTPCLEALKLLDRLRILVEQQVFCLPEHPMHIAISIGLTQYDASRHTPQAFVDEADAALYEAKNGGRNQVRVFGMGASVTLSPQPVLVP